MSSVAAIAVGAVSARGAGDRAYRVEDVGVAPASAIGVDRVLAEAGLLRPRAARYDALVTSGDRAADLLGDALAQCVARLDGTEPGWRGRRLGVCLGTSSGGMLAAERFFTELAAGQATAVTAAKATYYAPFDDALAAHGLAGVDRRVQVVSACASSTLAIGIAMRWLQRGACDLVLAGGYDAVSLFVAAGFESLRATAAATPRPFRVGRDGMSLGEGAAVLALVRSEAAPRARWHLSGFGASSDAVHITAPDREGGGLVRAGRRALAEAGLSGAEVGLVSAHATATPYNDAAEARAIAALCSGEPVVHPFKAEIGHTLGAAGALELLAIADALARGVAPGAIGEGDVDPDARVRLLPRAEPCSSEAALKLSAAFGGVTAALAVTQAPRLTARAVLPVSAIAHARVADVDRPALAAALDLPVDRLARIDDLGQLALAAMVALRDVAGADAFAGAGVVQGHALATLDTNQRFHARMLAKGPRWVDPRRFPATSPNAGAGHAAIALELTGPNLAVGCGLGGGLEALQVAAELIAAGDAERMVVVVADDAGPAACRWHELCAPERPFARGAVAVLLAAGDAGERVDLDAAIDHSSGPIGHLALLDRLAPR